MSDTTDKIIDLTKTVRNITQDAISGNTVILSKDETIARLRICNTCEFLKNKEWLICGKCGCFMKAKAKFASAKCPVGKW